MIAALLKGIIVLLAVLNFGYMSFDGTRALVKGDYIRPTTGEYAGQLGPWSKLVKSAGIDPESAAMKSIFMLWGLAGLTITVFYIFNAPWARNALLVANILSLWYLIPGTISSGLQIILLLVRR